MKQCYFELEKLNYAHIERICYCLRTEANPLFPLQNLAKQDVLFPLFNHIKIFKTITKNFMFIISSLVQDKINQKLI